MMHYEHKDEDTRRIAGLVATMPDAQPPDDLIDAVMSRIRPHRPSLAMRIKLLLRRRLRSGPLLAAAGGLIVGALLMTVFIPLGSAPRTSAPSGETQEVLFTFFMPGASSIDLVGSFNQWNPEGFQLNRGHVHGLWQITVALPPGRHSYSFIVDNNKAVPDPKAPVKELDGFGSVNSVLILEGGEHVEKRRL